MIAWAVDVLTRAVAEYGALPFGIAVFGYVLGGFIKGTIGFALPTVAIAIAATVLPPEVAVAYLTVPTFVMNIWQSVRHGWRAAWQTMKAFRLLIAVMLGSLLIATQILPFLNERAFAGIVGLGALSFSAAQLAGWRPREPSRPLADVVTGVISGFFGGVSGAWGPPTLILLLALNLQKQEFVRSCGVIFVLGSIPFMIGHVSTGVLNAETATISALLLLPVAVGMGLGLKLQDRLDGETVRRLILIVLLLAGLNFLRRAILG